MFLQKKLKANNEKFTFSVKVSLLLSLKWPLLSYGRLSIELSGIKEKTYEFLSKYLLQYSDLERTVNKKTSIHSEKEKVWDMGSQRIFIVEGRNKMIFGKESFRVLRYFENTRRKSTPQSRISNR